MHLDAIYYEACPDANGEIFRTHVNANVHEITFRHVLRNVLKYGWTHFLSGPHSNALQMYFQARLDFESRLYAFVPCVSGAFIL